MSWVGRVLACAPPGMLGAATQPTFLQHRPTLQHETQVINDNICLSVCVCVHSLICIVRIINDYI